MWLKSISEMGPAFSQLHHVLHDDTTKACLLTVSLRRSVRSGLLQTSWARSVAHRNARYLFVPCCMADVMSMSTTATPPYLECPKSNAQRHGLLATVTSCQQRARSSLSNTDCLRHSLCDVTAVFSRSVTATQWMKAVWRNGWMVVKNNLRFWN